MNSAQPHRVFTLWVLLLSLSACATPVERLTQLSKKLDLDRHTIQTKDFLQVIYSNKHTSLNSRHLHVYLEGDGSPWLDRFTVAADPTPRNPVALKLMALDTQPAIYLSRPCYGIERKHQQPNVNSNCQPLLWTHQRYSATVVGGMVAALRIYLNKNPYTHLSFIGYSGGGVLAMLLAPRFEQTHTVVTIAANLDTQKWTRLHEFSELSGSINPAGQEPLRPSIRQVHFIGGQDTNVPQAIVTEFLQQQSNSKTVVLPHFDHVCCWEQQWPELLPLYVLQ
ncbi:MAG: hypothetical protein OEZ68_16605 [Gammaproteobacteria bacterium]|nr:hypothetical protein [Gammaproteobacteria bacterium]MDH5802424.1 hypothetical protein [Gammaproteobacteria bacterium]